MRDESTEISAALTETVPAGHKGAIRRENERRIREAAERVFSEHGFRGASMGMIAEEAGVPKPNVYYYFGSKEDLYRLVIESICDTWLEAAATFDDMSDPADAFRGYVGAKMDLARMRPEGSRLWAIEMARGAPFIQDYLRHTVKPWLDAREARIAKWVADGTLPPVPARALIYMIWAMTQYYADYDAQIRAMNDGAPLTPAQFDAARENVIALVLRALKLA